MNKRMVYLIICLASGILGFVLKLFTASMPFFVANYMPQILWAGSIYLLIAFIINKKAPIHGVTSLIVALCLETLQLYNPSWLLPVRSTQIGAFVLGTNFMLTDIFCIIGTIAVCFIADFIISSKKPKVRKSKYRK